MASLAKDPRRVGSTPRLISERGVYGVDEAFLTTGTLLDALVRIDSSPWSEWKGGKPITARGLAKLLDPFGIHPDRTREVRGYNRRSFVDAWTRFLPPIPAVPVTSVTPVDLVAEARRTFGDDLVPSEAGWPA